MFSLSSKSLFTTPPPAPTTSTTRTPGKIRESKERNATYTKLNSLGVQENADGKKAKRNQQRISKTRHEREEKFKKIVSSYMLSLCKNSISAFARPLCEEENRVKSTKDFFYLYNEKCLVVRLYSFCADAV